MKNFIFISPNFPTTYWRFCRELKNNGLNVLGIGDCPYDNLTVELKSSLNEYYKVSSLENYEEVYRAVAFFTFKYGKIDYIESNNEYWLERDANLRTEFNVTTGFSAKEIKRVKYKSEMKKYYKKAGVKVARHRLVKSLKGCTDFIKQVGYPVIVKPDNGVGATATYKLTCDEDLKAFLKTKPKNYIMEEYIHAVVNSYDAIVNSKGEPVFETGLVEMGDLMDIVNTNDNSLYYYLNEPLEDVKALGRKVLKAFGVKSRFVHFEFFRLLSDQYIGKRGEVVALEVNMRPAGGISPDMMNYANSTDVYKIWADMIAYDSSLVGCGKKYYCAFAGRRDGKNFRYSEQDIVDRFRKNLKAVERVPDALSNCMGNLSFLATFETKEEMQEFFDEAIE
ncbi:MAG: carbamoylphosphate synthase large subunit [Ruminococcus flavefaciens]|nr:carbamoylphosphate synthase large subunit [Ruminococcus flavefaciens]